MSKFWTWTVIVVAILAILGIWWWQRNSASESGSTNESAMSAAAIQSRDNSDASLSQDQADITSQMNQLGADASVAAQAAATAQ